MEATVCMFSRVFLPFKLIVFKKNLHFQNFPWWPYTADKKRAQSHTLYDISFTNHSYETILWILQK